MVSDSYYSLLSKLVEAETNGKHRMAAKLRKKVAMWKVSVK